MLLVEPDASQAEDMDQILQQNGEWEVTRASCLMDAIRVAGEMPFDAAILDYAQPDGTGLDILDFLRIGSPGIRILLVSEEASEDVVFHALSHGVGDYLVKDKHLAVELPHRVHALMERDMETQALVETFAANTYDIAPDAHFTPERTAATPVERTLQRLVGGPISAAAVYDGRGGTIASMSLRPDSVDGIGFALATIHGQVGALWTYGELRPFGYDILVDTDAGLVGITAIPGTYIVAIVMRSDTPRADALERLTSAAARVLDTITD